jgi:hypothetical protein
LTQLEGINLSHNQISDLTPLAELTQLEGINLSHNQISDLTPLAKLTQLKGLDLGVNQISNLKPLEKLTRLKGLSLACNQIIDVTTLAKLTDLEWLELTCNPIPDKPLLENLPSFGNPSNAYTVVIVDIHLDDVGPRYLWFVMGRVEIYFQHANYFELALWDASTTYPEIYLNPYTGECTEPSKLEADVNGDGDVNIQDLVLVANNFGKTDAGDADVNADGVVNITDLVLVAGGIGQ